MLGRERVADLDGVGPVGRSQRQGPRLQHPGPNQLVPYARPCAQGWGVVPAQPSHLLDEVRFARHIGPPAGHLYRETLILGRRDETDRREDTLDVAARDLDAEQVADACRPQEHAPGLLGLRPQVERCLSQLPARHRDDEVDRAAHRIGHTEEIDPTFEPVAGLAGEAERAARAPDAGRLEVGALEHQIGSLLAHLGLGAAHHARDDRGPLGVADRGHLRRQLPGDSVERGDRLVGLGAPDHDGGSAQAGEVECMERLVQLEEDVVRRVHHVVDRALADRGEPRRQPLGAFPDSHAADHRRDVTRTALRVLETDLDAVDYASVGLSDSRTVGRSARPPDRLTARDLGQLHRPAQHGGDLARHALVAQQVGSVGGHVKDELIVGDGHRIEKARAGGSRGVQLEEAGVILAQSELARRQQHPVGLDATNLAALELDPARERGAYGGEGVFPARLHVGRAAHHLERPADPAGVDEAQRQAVSVGVWLRLEHLGDEHVSQVLVHRHDGLHRRARHRQAFGDLARHQGAPQQRLEPPPRDDHRCGLANWERNRTSSSQNSRMSETP